MFIRGEAARLEDIVKALQIPKDSLLDEFKRVELELKKRMLVLAAKTSSDKAVLKLRLDKVEQAERRNTILQQQAGQFDRVNRQMDVEMLKTIEEIKEQQSKRMNMMMKLLEDRMAYKQFASPPRMGMRMFEANGPKQAPQVRSLRRRSTLADMLPNYDPEVQRLLEATLRGNSSDTGGKYSRGKDTQGRQFESTSGTKEWGGSTPRTDEIVSKDVSQRILMVGEGDDFEDLVGPGTSKNKDSRLNPDEPPTKGVDYQLRMSKPLMVDKGT